MSFGLSGEWVEITVDSAAEESVCPQDRRKQFWMWEVSRKMNSVNASGGKINHYGQREVVVKTAQSF